jgi:hypothetical protein
MISTLAAPANVVGLLKHYIYISGNKELNGGGCLYSGTRESFFFFPDMLIELKRKNNQQQSEWKRNSL